MLYKRFSLSLLAIFLLGVAPAVVPVGPHVADAEAAACSPTESTFTGDGTIGTSGVDYNVLLFASTGSCDWTVPSGVTTIDYLIVGAGGAGGSTTSGSAGGGGGGRVLESTNLDVSSVATIGVVVGAGGNPTVPPVDDTASDANTNPSSGEDGESSSITPSGRSTITALGGSGGANAWLYNSGNSTQLTPSTTGWNGGGGSVHAATKSSGSVGEGGNDGGDAYPHGGLTNPQAGGGGGGSGADGADAVSGAGGDGGSGAASTIRGASANYGGGGGGGKRTSSGSSGSGTDGGGDGGKRDDGVSGTANTGGGGGGGAGDALDTLYSGGAGGSGVVVLRYSLTPGPPTSTSVSSGDGEMTLTYTPPTHWGGGTLDIQYTTDNGSNWRSLGETDGNTTVALESDGTALQNNTLYTVKLRSTNDVASGYSSSEVTVGDVIPSAVGEILRLDATHPEYDDETGSGKEWNDQAGSLDADAQGDPTYNSRTKAFEFDGTDDHFDLPDIAVDFSNGLAIHVTADFGSVDTFERLIDFGNGSTSGFTYSPADNIFFGREGTDSDRLQLVVYRDGTVTGYCYADDTIELGFHTYSVVIDPDRPSVCEIYRDASPRTVSYAGGEPDPPGGSNFIPRSVIRTNNYIGRSNWHVENVDEDFAGSIQSVVMYNTAQTTPTCVPFTDTYTGDGSAGDSGVPYTYASFTTVGECTWTAPSGVALIDYLVVAGGGGGGHDEGGGGGAGGLLTGADLPVTAGGSVTVEVGIGGAGSPTDIAQGGSVTLASNGGDSVFSTVTATGGGGGGDAINSADGGLDGADGGSGGGGAGENRSGSGGSGTDGQGNDGSDGGPIGGGGGGAGSASTGSRHGGSGESSTLTGSAVTYAAGGGGGWGNSQSSGGGSGGDASAGTGGDSDTAPGYGASNSGSGGGGGGGNSGTNVGNTYAGGDGGSGIVIVRYSLSPAAPTISSVSSGDGSLSVSFSAPSHTGGSAITDYEYSFDGSTWTSFGSASAGTKTISGLTNGTAYTPRIRAVNGNGNGVPVTAGSATTPRGSQTLTWNPTNTSVEVKDGSVTLAPAASALGGVTIEYSVQTAGDPSCAIADDSTPTVTYSAEGTCVIRATAVEGGAYLSATTDVTLTVSKSSQTITFASVSDKTYGDSAFALTVSSNSGLTVTVTPADTSVCTVASTTVTIVSLGTCSLTATQAGDSEYDAATDVTRSFTVAAKPITMSVAISDKTYDGLSAASVSGTPSLTGVEAGDTSDVAVDTAEISAEFADPDAGLGKSVTVTLGDEVLTGDRSDRYTVTVSNSPTAAISKANQSSLAITSGNSMVYGQSIPVVAVGGSSSGDLSYSKVSGPCTVTGSTVTSTGAGSCVVSATREADTNYNSVSSADFTITISKANQSINFTSTVPVSAVSGTTYTPTATASSALTVSFSITTGSGTVCSLSSGVVTFAQSGTCVITASQAGDSDYNAASAVTQTIVAGKINQTISFPSITGKDFDAPAFAAGATVSSGRTVTFATSTGSVCAVDASTGVVSIKTIGDCTVTASSSGDASYAAASDVSRTFTISPVLAGKPSITSASFGDSSVTVGFVAPGSNGGDAVDGYQLVATSSGGSVTKPDCSTTSPCTISGLINGEAYTVTIAAINAAGVGPASSASPSVTPATVADAVSGLATTPGDEELQVTWTALTTGQLGGGDFNQYDVYLRVNGGSWGSAVTPDGTNNLGTRTTNSYTFTGLTNGTAYDVKVVAITTANSTQLSSNTSTALGVPATVPDAPTGLVLSTLSNTSALASWAAPADDGGDAVSAYDVNISCTFVNATDTFCTLTGLTAGSRVTVSVGATNLMGTGATVSAVITMPGGSSGSSESSGSSGGSSATPTVTPSPPTVSPIVPRGRLPLPAQATPNPRLLDGPIVQPGNRPDVNGPPRARIGGVPAPVTNEASGTSGVGVRAGVLQLNISVPDGAGGGVSENTSTGLPELMVPTGQSTRVAGGGLLPGSSLQVWLPDTAGAPRELARIPVMPDGSFDSDVSFTSRQGEMPLPVGRQLVQVAGYDENGNQTVVDMTINIGQGPPQPETNRQTEALPQLTSGQTLATSAGMPEQVRIEVRAEERQVAILSGDWSFEVTVEEETGAVADDAGALAVQLVQEKTADVSGSGFQPDSRVDVWLFSDPTLLGSVTVSADGSFTTQFYLDPRYATPGEHTLQLQGVASDGYIKAANVGVKIVEPAAPTAAATSMTLLWIALASVVLVVILILAVAIRRRATARR